jgi:Mg-chelatase subunit ChlD
MGRVLVYNTKTNQILTSYGTNSSKKAGTQKYNPVLLKKSAEHDNKASRKDHNKIKQSVIMQKDKWKSHTVIVVDMSGSMRTDDVNGARCRSDGVWMVLARDFLMKRLEERDASIFDLVSIILMKDPEAVVFCLYEPMTWVLYNKLVDLREWQTEKPCGGGCYLPALIKAKELLSFNSMCPVLSLFFVSDGKPSDSSTVLPEITETMGNIASSFGRRLIVTLIGMADKRKENFCIMKEMAKEASDYGCPSEFNAPDLSAHSLSSIIHSSSSSMTSTKTELTDIRTGKLRTVRTDVLREKLCTPDDNRINDEWDVFLSTNPNKYTKDVYVWCSKMNDFAILVNPRCFSCSKLVKLPTQANTEAVYDGLLCPRCKACYMCFDCLEGTKGWLRRYDWSLLEHDCIETARLRRSGLIVQKSLPSFSVAKKKRAFGEGAERLAFKFRFVGADGVTFVGPKMVAKESRFIETKGDGDKGNIEDSYLMSDRFSYHKQFMRTHAIASRFAGIYNKALDSLPATAITLGYPRIRFLDPMVVEMEEKFENGTIRISNVLVEPMIEGVYRKYNSNNGKIGTVASLKTVATDDLDKEDEASQQRIYGLLYRGRNVPQTLEANDEKEKMETNLLEVIAECSDEDTDSENDEEPASPKKQGAREHEISMYDHLIDEEGNFPPLDPHVKYKMIRDEDFAQAFSHFTYVRSKGQLMVVDLQGTLQVQSIVKSRKVLKTKEFVFTDPAIHKRKRAMGHQFLRQLNLGRTNRGREGMNDFWETHVCNDACRVFGLRPREKYSTGWQAKRHTAA